MLLLHLDTNSLVESDVGVVKSVGKLREVV